MIQSNKISVIYLYLKQNCYYSKSRALLLCASNCEIFLAVVLLENSLLFRFCNFTMLQKQEKSLHLSKQTEQYELNSVSNMPAKIDIDALKIFTKSRTNETEYRKKSKNSQSQLDIYRF